MMLKLFRLFVTVLVCVSHAQAGTSIAVRSPEVRAASFQGWVEARVGTERLSEVLASKEMKSESLVNLERELQLAQSAFLGSSPDEARAHFTKIIALAHEADWSTNARQSIYYSYLRLAQMALTDLDRTRYLFEATSFAPDLHGNPKLFPPPLLQQLRVVREQVKAKSLNVDFNQQFEGFEIVVLDGKRFDLPLSEDVLVTPGEHRFSFYSDTFAPQNIVLKGTQITVFQPLRQSLINGDCETPMAIIPEILVGKTITAVKEESCIKTWIDGAWIHGWQSSPASTSPQPGLAANGLSVSNTLSPRFSSETMNRWPTRPSEPPRPFYKRTWFLVGLGAMVATSAALIQRESQRHRSGAAQEPEIRPTQSEGL